MYEDAFEMTEHERRQVQEILADMQRRGGKLTDSAGKPVEYRVLGGRRFLVCEQGRVWRYAPSGSPCEPGRRGGSLRRNDAVEMWTGKWRRLADADGRSHHDKCLVWVALDANINGRPGIAKIAWYLAEKGFRHPLEGPGEPSDGELAALAGRQAEAADAVAARMAAEGLARDEPAAQRADDAAGEPQPAAPVEKPRSSAVRLVAIRKGKRRGR